MNWKLEITINEETLETSSKIVSPDGFYCKFSELGWRAQEIIKKGVHSELNKIVL